MWVRFEILFSTQPEVETAHAGQLKELSSQVDSRQNELASCFTAPPPRANVTGSMASCILQNTHMIDSDVNGNTHLFFIIIIIIIILLLLLLCFTVQKHRGEEQIHEG